MRLPWKSSVPSRRASGLCAVFVLLVSPAALCLLLTCPPAMAAGASATDDVSISPGGDAVWLAGSGHDLTCNEPDGVDLCPPDEEFEEEEPIPHIEWSCNKGTFANNKTISIGTAVRYICPNTAENDVKIKVVAYIDEEPASEDEKNVKVVIPWVEELKFLGHLMKDDSDDPNSIVEAEYNKTANRNHPVCLDKGSTVVLSGIKFQASDNLTAGTSVVVNLTGTVDFDEENDTWETWNSDGLAMVSQDTAAGRTRNSVGIYDGDFSLTWKYKVPSGSNNYIACADVNPTKHKVYVVLGPPCGSQSIPWQKVLDQACEAAEYAMSESTAMYYIWSHVYFSVGGYYNGRGQYTENGEYFKLKSWLANPKNVGKVNCHDLAQAVTVYANAVGCDAKWMVIRPFGYVNCIKPIGWSNWTNNPGFLLPSYDPNPIVNGAWDMNQGRSRFEEHSVVTLGDKFYDTSVGQVDVDNIPDFGPPHTAYYLNGSDTWDSLYRARVIDSDPVSIPGKPQVFKVKPINK